MQTLPTSAQVKPVDNFTIQKKGIQSIDLMESASTAFSLAFLEEVPGMEESLAILCGKGNNGADGLAIARMLHIKGYKDIQVYLLQFSDHETHDYRLNLERLRTLPVRLTTINEPSELSGLSAEVLIDAVLGSGLNKSLDGRYRQAAELINDLQRRVFAVDIPTGFPGEGQIAEGLICIKADLVICFQRPKINFYFPESVVALARFKVVDIGLDEEFIQQIDSPYQLMTAQDVCELVKPRKSFTHKGTYGHALVVAGQSQTMGAAMLCAKACMYSGAGLTTASIPDTGLTALNTALPEVMFLDRQSLLGTDPAKFRAIAMGPGLGTSTDSIELVTAMLKMKYIQVIDADALNIIGSHPALLSAVAPGSILTPHMKEFDHLFGQHTSWWERLQTARRKAEELACVIVLKNQYTFIVNEKGKVIINSTGNPAMAQGGMGDVLTGITVSFLAQGHRPAEAACIACYLHGKAGDELAAQRTNVSASEVAERVPVTLKKIVK